MFDVTIATHGAMPEGSTDDRLLAEAVSAAGARVRLCVWNDPMVDWSLSGRVVIRSTWDYHLEPGAWLAWLAAAPTPLVNDVRMLCWNTDKRYLFELQRSGVAIVPTALVSRAAPADLAGLAEDRGWPDIVVKPVIGASAKGAARFTGPRIDADAQAHLDGLLQHGDALVQPFQEAVEGARERSLVYIGGAFSHAFTKPPFLRGTGDGLGEALHVPSEAELALAAAALRAAPAPVTYARVDLVPTGEGPRLMELELIEPDLGLRLQSRSADALASALLAVLV